MGSKAVELVVTSSWQSLPLHVTLIFGGLLVTCDDDDETMMASSFDHHLIFIHSIVIIFRPNNNQPTTTRRRIVEKDKCWFNQTSNQNFIMVLFKSVAVAGLLGLVVVVSTAASLMMFLWKAVRAQLSIQESCQQRRQILLSVILLLG